MIKPRKINHNVKMIAQLKNIIHPFLLLLMIGFPSSFQLDYLGQEKKREGKKGAFAKLLLLDPLLSWRCAFFGLSSFVSSLIDTMVVETKRQEICKTHWTWEML